MRLLTICSVIFELIILVSSKDVRNSRIDCISNKDHEGTVTGVHLISRIKKSPGYDGKSGDYKASVTAYEKSDHGGPVSDDGKGGGYYGTPNVYCNCLPSGYSKSGPSPAYGKGGTSTLYHKTEYSSPAGYDTYGSNNGYSRPSYEDKGNYSLPPTNIGKSGYDSTSSSPYEGKTGYSASVPSFYGSKSGYGSPSLFVYGGKGSYSSPGHSAYEEKVYDGPALTAGDYNFPATSGYSDKDIYNAPASKFYEAEHVLPSYGLKGGYDAPGTAYERPTPSYGKGHVPSTYAIKGGYGASTTTYKRPTPSYGKGHVPSTYGTKRGYGASSTIYKHPTLSYGKGHVPSTYGTKGRYGTSASASESSISYGKSGKSGYGGYTPHHGGEYRSLGMVGAMYSSPNYVTSSAYAYTYPSPGPTVPCGQNILAGCQPSVQMVPCSAREYPTRYDYAVLAPNPLNKALKLKLGEETKVKKEKHSKYNGMEKKERNNIIEI